MSDSKRAIYRDDIDLLLEQADGIVQKSREKYFTPCRVPQMNNGEIHLFCVPEKVTKGKDRYLYERHHHEESFEACGPLAKITILQVKRSRSGNQTWYRGSYRIEETYYHD